MKFDLRRNALKLFDRFRFLGAGVAVSFALSFMLCVFAPYELFLTNQGEFWFDAKMMILPVALLFLTAFAALLALFFIMRLIGKTPFFCVLTVAMSALVYFYIQGNFFISGLPPLDGTNIDWNAPSPERIKSIAAIIISAGLFIFLFLKLSCDNFAKLSFYGSLALSLMLVITMTTLVLTTEIQDKTGQLNCYDKGEFEYSDKENIIVLVLDSLDAGTFEEALEKNPEFADTFDDFTYFDNTLAAYPFSMHAVPHLLTGEWYENNGDFHRYVQSSIDRSPLIGALEKNEYKMGIYSPSDIKLEGAVHDGRYENQIALKDSFTTKKGAMVMMAKMAGLKYAPWDLKEKCYNMTEHSESIRNVESGDGYEFYSWDNGKFYNAIRKEDTITVTDDKTFRFIHLYGAHLPLWYNKDLSKAENPTYLGNVEACLTLCDTYIKSLKAAGVYENSSIVILADHGYIHPYTEETIRERMHCALLIKGRGEHGDEMSVSSAPISYADLAPSFVGLIEGKGAREIFEYKDGDTRERRFIWYCYTKEDYMEEYIAEGRADEVDKMKPTGNIYKK